MKHLVILLLLVLLTSCVKQETIEKHEVMLLMVDIPSKKVFLYDITDNSYVPVAYSYKATKGISSKIAIAIGRAKY